MLAEVCRFYGWTPEYCLKMPAFLFFGMAAQAKKVVARERLQSMKLHVIPAMKHEYIEKLQREYMATAYPKLPESEVVEAPSAALEWTDPEAQAFIRHAFSEHRRSHYGR